MRTLVSGGWRVRGWLVALLLMASGGLALAGQDRAAAPSASAAAAVQGQPPSEGYVGAQVCGECHVEPAASYQKTAHARAWNARTPAAARGCETCHGPGGAHVKDPTTSLKKFLTMSPRDVSASCMECHNREEHAQWQGGMHDARNITCVTCHSVHGSQSEKGLLKRSTVTATCAQCHRDKAARLQRSAHMPVREGKMECTSCHNQHGSTNVRLLRTGNTVNEFCTSCHAEKRGPFLWDHPPVRESCVTCHDPHGSSNDRLLVVKAPMLCQRCHVPTRHPATPYDGLALVARSNRLVNRGCVNCHSNIHGSNHPSGQFFQR